MMEKTVVYGIGEIARAISVPASRISVWVARGKLPPPTWVLDAGKVWTGDQIEAWIDEHSAGNKR